MPIREYSLAKVLQGLEINFEEFTDLCILLGCDYCDSIKGIGQKRALELIKQYRNIETILKNIDKKVVTMIFLRFCFEKIFFRNTPFQKIGHLIKLDNCSKNRTFYLLMPSKSVEKRNFSLKFSFAFQLKWSEPDEDALVAYMATEKGFA